MSADAAKELCRQFYECLFQDLPAALSLVACNYVDHNNEQAGHGPEVLRAHVLGLLTTFPDFNMSIEQMISEGDLVVTRVTGAGTHSGRWMNILPTGAVVNVRGINIDRVADGKIAEHWGEADTVGMLFQMGIDPFAGRST